MKNAYILLQDVVLIKYLITEAILANQFGDDYIILQKYNMENKRYINDIKSELAKYRQEFSDIYEDFSSTSASDFSKNYQDYISNNTQVLIYTISNGKEMNQSLPFSTAINRIPTTVFYISSITDDKVILSMDERNSYELMVNLLNGYFNSIKNFTNILSELLFQG